MDPYSCSITGILILAPLTAGSAADQMPDSYWIQTILKGKGSMPAVRITEEQAQIVIDYIRDSN